MLYETDCRQHPNDRHVDDCMGVISMPIRGAFSIPFVLFGYKNIFFVMIDFLKEKLIILPRYTQITHLNRRKVIISVHSIPITVFLRCIRLRIC